MSGLVVLVAVGLMLRIAWLDFWTYRIRNRDSAFLLAVYVAWRFLSGPEVIIGDLVAGAVLFLIAIVMWLVRVMGAGDVKLYAVLGMFVGYFYLTMFVLLLLVASVFLFVVLSVARKSEWHSGVPGRLTEIARSGKSPYGVVMCAAAIPTLLVRAFV